MSRPGYVYVIRGPDDLFKIGHSRDYKSRIATFAVVLPFDVEYELVLRSDDRVELEGELHDKFDERRVRGEWFNLSNHDLFVLWSCTSELIDTVWLQEQWNLIEETIESPNLPLHAAMVGTAIIRMAIASAFPCLTPNDFEVFSRWWKIDLGNASTPRHPQDMVEAISDWQTHQYGGT